MAACQAILAAQRRRNAAQDEADNLGGKQGGGGSPGSPSENTRRRDRHMRQDLRKALYAAHPLMAGIDAIENDGGAGTAKAADLGGKMAGEAFQPAITDFYLTNPIARASATMAECSALAKARAAEAAE